MKKLLVPFLIVIILMLIGLFFWRETALKNYALTQQISLLQEQLSGMDTQFQQLTTGTDIQVSSGTISQTDIEADTDSRYRKIYSNKYSLYTKNSTIYEICLAANRNVCINMYQYDGSFRNYYLSLMPQADRDNLSPSRQPTITQTIQGKKTRKCTLYIESTICFNESSDGTLVMVISDQQGEGFNGGPYDPTDILKVIDF